MFETIRNAVRHHELILSFAVRDIKTRYKQTALGVAWALLQPLSMMLVFTLVFSIFAKVPSDGIPYPVFAYSGLIFWTFFSNSISGGTLAMTANSALIRKIYFPRETLLLAVMLAGLLDLVIASLLFGAMLVYYKITLTVAAFWILPLLLVQMILALGVISITSATHVNFRDIGHALPLLVQLWMFATPVAYPISVVPRWLKPLFLLNPMAPIIDGYRRAIIQDSRPDLEGLAVSVLITLTLTVTALAIFRRAERTFADVI